MNKKKAIAELLARFDFEVRGNDIWQKRIAYMPAQPFGRTCRDIFDAADQLIPIIHDDGYHNQLNQINDAP
jgi:hypothetical protein